MRSRYFFINPGSHLFLLDFKKISCLQWSFLFLLNHQLLYSYWVIANSSQIYLNAPILKQTTLTSFLFNHHNFQNVSVLPVATSSSPIFLTLILIEFPSILPTDVTLINVPSGPHLARSSGQLSGFSFLDLPGIVPS